MNEHFAAADRFAALLARAGASPQSRHRAVWAYLRALSAASDTAWNTFYRCVRSAAEDVIARGVDNREALSGVVRLLDDDFGSPLLTHAERERLWNACVEESRSEASLSS